MSLFISGLSFKPFIMTDDSLSSVWIAQKPESGLEFE